MDNINRKNIILQKGRKFYLLVPSDEDIESARTFFADCVRHFGGKKGNIRNDLFLELAILTSDVPVIAVSGFWPETGPGLPNNVLMGCDIFVDNEYSTVRKNEYISKLFTVIDSVEID